MKYSKLFYHNDSAMTWPDLNDISDNDIMKRRSILNNAACDEKNIEIASHHTHFNENISFETIVECL